MDRIEKAFSKLSEKERRLVKTLLSKLMADDVFGLDLQKLTGHDDIFRLRKGDLRLIYRKAGRQMFLLAIERRSEKTYRDF